MSTSPRKRPAPEALVAGLVVVILVALVGAVFLTGAGASLYPPDAATTQAKEISELYDIVFAIAVAIFVAVEGLIVWSVLRYRRRPSDIELPPQTHGNNFVEVLWTLIPTVIVLYLFVISWQTLNTVDTSVSARSRTSRSRRIAGQFQWQFEYLDADGNHIATQTQPRRRRDTGVAAWPFRSGEGLRDPRQPGRDPRLVRPALPLQARRRPRARRTTSSSPWIRPRPVRPSTASAPSCAARAIVMHFDVVASSRRTSMPGWRPRRQVERHAAAAAVRAPVLNLAAKNVKYDKAALEAPADAPFVIEFTNKDPAGITHDVDIRDSGHGRREPGHDRRRQDRQLRVHPVAGGHLHVLLLDPQQHDRHPDGQVRSASMATHALTPAAVPAYPGRVVRVAHDDRSQEDRDHVPDQLVLLLPDRRRLRAAGADRTGAARASSCSPTSTSTTRRSRSTPR